MWLNKKRIAEVLTDNGLTPGDLARQVGLQAWQLAEILDGRKPADRRTAALLLTIFGIWNICWAMKENWRWMPYALKAVAAH